MMLKNAERTQGAEFGAPPTLSTTIVRHIKDAILRGDYPPGSALPEIPLARKMMASRATIREALRGLSDMGLVVLHARRGACVASLSPQRVREIFSLRAVLESYAVKLALTEGKIRREEIAHIEVMFDRLRQSVEGRDPFALIESDMAFHWAVCEPSGHELLLEQLRGLQVRTRQFIVFTKLYHSDAEGEVEAHTPILMAVRSQDPQRAEMAMRDHITTAGERLLVRMSESTQRQAASSDFVGLA